MITVERIDTGRYIIGDREYGYTLCRVDFSLEAIEQMTEEQLESLATSIKNTIVERLGLDGTGQPVR